LTGTLRAIVANGKKSSAITASTKLKLMSVLVEVLGIDTGVCPYKLLAICCHFSVVANSHSNRLLATRPFPSPLLAHSASARRRRPRRPSSRSMPRSWSKERDEPTGFPRWSEGLSGFPKMIYNSYVGKEG